VELPSLTFQPQDISQANLILFDPFWRRRRGRGCQRKTNEGAQDSRHGNPTRFPDSLGAMGFDLRDSGFHILLAKAFPEMIGGKIAAAWYRVSSTATAGSAKKSRAGFCILAEHGCSETSKRSSACASATPSHPGTFSGNVGICPARRSFSFSRSGWKKTLKAGEYALAAAFWPGLQRGISAIAMDVSVYLFLALLLVVGLLRLVELRISKPAPERNVCARCCESRRTEIPLDGSAAHLCAAWRGTGGGPPAAVPFILWLGAPMIVVFLAANAVRWWVIRSLGEHWNVQVVDSTRLGVVTSGPFRYGPASNYAAVFAEMLALPLIHTAWITAVAGAIAHIGVLAQRLSTEERVLFANPDYRAAMTGKSRFLAGTFLKEKLSNELALLPCQFPCSCSRRPPAQFVLTRSPRPRHSQPWRNSRRDFILSTRRTSRKRGKNLTHGNLSIPKNLLARSPSRPAIFSKNFTVKACSPAIFLE